VAFIAARVPPLTDRLTTRWEATPDSLAPIRYLLRRWLLERGATQNEAFDVMVATQEACANAVEHAYGPVPAAFEVEGRFADGVVTPTVTDRGRWRPPRGHNRGRGLPLMRELMDSVDISQTDLDSAGIALLFGLSSTLRQHQQQLRLVVADGSPIARMVRLTGLTDAVPTHPTLQAALAES
jgi:anti-sigma regulatory factor (Ser/Thr protein kinase)